MHHSVVTDSYKKIKDIHEDYISCRVENIYHAFILKIRGIKEQMVKSRKIIQMHSIAISSHLKLRYKFIELIN